MKITGLTKKSPDNLLLDAGAFFKNYDVTTDTVATASAKLLGATQGGGSFSAVPNIRNIEFDGASGAVKGLELIDYYTVTMVANVKEVTADNIKIALGAATAITATNLTNYSKITANSEITDDDYIDNITWIGTLKGSATPVIIVLKNALSLNGLNLTLTDKSEAVIPLTLTGHYDIEALDVAPFEIYYPTITESADTDTDTDSDADESAEV